jgi:hypothetical protein
MVLPSGGGSTEGTKGTRTPGRGRERRAPLLSTGAGGRNAAAPLRGPASRLVPVLGPVLGRGPRQRAARPRVGARGGAAGPRPLGRAGGQRRLGAVSEPHHPHLGWPVRTNQPERPPLRVLDAMALTQTGKGREHHGRLVRTEMRATIRAPVAQPLPVHVERLNRVGANRLACLTHQTHASPSVPAPVMRRRDWPPSSITGCTCTPCCGR